MCSYQMQFNPHLQYRGLITEVAVNIFGDSGYGDMEAKFADVALAPSEARLLLQFWILRGAFCSQDQDCAYSPSCLTQALVRHADLVPPHDTRPLVWPLHMTNALGCRTVGNPERRLLALTFRFRSYTALKHISAHEYSAPVFWQYEKLR